LPQGHPVLRSRVNAATPPTSAREIRGRRRAGPAGVRGGALNEAAAPSGRPRGRAGGQRWRPWSSKPHPRANRSRTRRPPGTPGRCRRPPGRCPERRRDTRGGGEGQVDHRTGGEEARWCCGGAHTHRHRWQRRPRPRGTDTHATESVSYSSDAADLALRDEDGGLLGGRDLTGQEAPNRGRGSL
jgi:hypothetical protein